MTTPLLTNEAPRSTSLPARIIASRWTRRLLAVAFLAGLAFVALPQLAGLSDIWSSMASMSTTVIVLLSITAAWNLASYAFVLTAATPGLSYPQSLVVTTASTAVANTAPAGGALGVGVLAAMYRSWGFSAASTSLAVVATGIWNVLVKLSVPILAVALFLITGDVTWGRTIGASVGVAIVVVVIAAAARFLRNDRAARRVATMAATCVNRLRRIVRRGAVTGWADAASSFRQEADSVLRGRWLRLTGATLLSQVSLFVVLYLAMRGVGIGPSQVGWAEALGAFAFVRLLAIVPISPGGVGVVEVGLSGALISAGADRGPAVAAVLVFRALTYVAPVLFGLPAYVWWRRRSTWRRPIDGDTIGEPADQLVDKVCSEKKSQISAVASMEDVVFPSTADSCAVAALPGQVWPPSVIR